MTHWTALLTLALAISAAFAFLMRETPKERLFFGLKMFFGLVLFTYIVGWITYFLPWW
jgi:hypothetical protein